MDDRTTPLARPSKASPSDGPGILRIAVVIPLYNGEWCVEETLRSVIAQTLPADEIVVVDDGSTDGSAALVERLASEHPIKLLHKPNGGQSSARNHGVRHATCNLIAFLDQDDIWYPNHLARLVEPFHEEHYPPLGWAHSNFDLVDAAGETIFASYLDEFGTERSIRSLPLCLSEDMRVLPSCTLVSRAAFDAIGGFDERLSGYEDDDLFLRIFRRGYRNIYINSPLTRWRQHSGSATRSPRMVESCTIYTTKLLEQFPDDPLLRLFYAQRYIMPRFIRAMRIYYRLAVADRDGALCRKVIHDLVSLRRYALRRHRVMLMIAAPFLRHLAFGRIFLGVWPLARRIMAPFR